MAQYCDGLQFMANQSIGVALEGLFLVEKAQLADIKRRIIEKTLMISSNQSVR